MRVLISGGAGFIGSHVTEAVLADGHEVAVVDDFSKGKEAHLETARSYRNLSLHRCDISTEHAAGLVRDFQPDVMLLLAAQASVQASLRDPLRDARINVLGTVNLLSAAALCGTKRVVFASSGGTVYGQAPEEALPLTEGLAKKPTSFYGLSKFAGQEYLRLFREHAGIEHVSLALGNVYGPRQDPSGEAGVVSIFAHRILNGEACTINGDGNTTRDYVFVSDVVDAFMKAMRRGSGLINIGTGVETSVTEVFRDLAHHAGRASTAPRYGPPLPGEVRRICLSPERAGAELGWTPTVAFEAGASRVISYHRRARRPS